MLASLLVYVLLCIGLLTESACVPKAKKDKSYCSKLVKKASVSQKRIICEQKSSNKCVYQGFDDVFFSPQNGDMKCVKHSINNLFQEPIMTDKHWSSYMELPLNSDQVQFLESQVLAGKYEITRMKVDVIANTPVYIAYEKREIGKGNVVGYSIGIKNQNGYHAIAISNIHRSQHWIRLDSNANPKRSKFNKWQEKMVDKVFYPDWDFGAGSLDLGSTDAMLKYLVAMAKVPQTQLFHMTRCWRIEKVQTPKKQGRPSADAESLLADIQNRPCKRTGKGETYATGLDVNVAPDGLLAGFELLAVLGSTVLFICCCVCAGFLVGIGCSFLSSTSSNNNGENGKWNI